MREDVAELCVNTARDIGADYAESRTEVGMSESVVLKNGNPEVAGFERVAGASVRVIVDGALGFGSINSFRKEEVKGMVERAVSLARSSRRNAGIRLSSEKTNTATCVVKEKVRLADIDLETKLGVLMEAEKAVLDGGVTAPGRIFILSTEVRERTYMNSEGTRVSSRIPRVGTFAILTVMESGQMEQAMISHGKSMGWEFIKHLDLPGRVSREAEMLKRLITEGGKPPEGEVDIVLGSEIAGIVAHESCGHPLEADRMLGREAAQAGESYASPDMLGTRIGNEAVTIIDDPTVENNYGYYRYDDEGVQARPRYLIKEGVITEFLMNRETAAELGRMSNAAARANNYDMEPIVRMSNTFFDTGDHSREELFEDIRLGVYMKTFSEWNIDDRRYNQRYVGRESYLIEGGEVRGLVRRPVLEVTTPGLFGSIDARGRTIERHSAQCGKGDPMQGIPVDHGGPELRARNIRLRSGV